MQLANPLDTSESPASQVESQKKDPYVELQKVVDEYVKPFEEALSSAKYNYERQKDRRDWPLDVALGGLFSNWARRRSEKALRSAERDITPAIELKQLIMRHALEYNTSLSESTFTTRFKFRMAFLKTIFSLPSGDTDAEKRLREGFEKFLSARKLIDLSHF